MFCHIYQIYHNKTARVFYNTQSNIAHDADS